MSHYSDIREAKILKGIDEEYDEWERASLIDLAMTPGFEGDIEGFDPVHKPKHYNSYPGVEVIDLTKHLNFCRGNVVKYVARAEFKENELQDLEKALWYLQTEIDRIKSNDK